MKVVFMAKCYEVETNGHNSCIVRRERDTKQVEMVMLLVNVRSAVTVVLKLYNIVLISKYNSNVIKIINAKFSNKTFKAYAISGCIAINEEKTFWSRNNGCDGTSDRKVVSMARFFLSWNLVRSHNVWWEEKDATQVEMVIFLLHFQSAVTVGLNFQHSIIRYA